METLLGIAGILAIASGFFLAASEPSWQGVVVWALTVLGACLISAAISIERLKIELDKETNKEVKQVEEATD